MILIDALNSLAVETGSLACLGCGHEHNCSIHGCAIIRAAVDLLKSQAAQAAEIAELQGRVAELDAQLTASQQETRAAVEDITQMARQHLLGDCTFCEHRHIPDVKHKPCKGCIQENRSHKHFKWRGPQKAGEEKGHDN